jgi:hypothetical protein
MDPLNITEDLGPWALSDFHPCHAEDAEASLQSWQEPFVNFAESLSSVDLADIGWW